MTLSFHLPKLKKYSFLIAFLAILFLSSNSNAQLTANFTANPTSGCAPLLVSFDSNSSIGNPNTWLWDFGDGSSTSNLQLPQHNYSSPGQYSVTLTIGNGTTTNTIVKSNYITVEANPIFDFSQSDSGCVGKTFNFLATTSTPFIQYYVWNFGDGTGNLLTTGPTNSHQYNTLGVFTVTLTLTTSSGCTSSLTKNNFILIGTQPNTTFSATPLVICFNENVQFTSLTPQIVTGWEWHFGDGSMSISENPNHQYNIDTSSIADPFDVSLIAFYNGCPDTLRQIDLITVNSPIPHFSYSMDTLSPYTVSFTNESGGADSYTWNFGDSSSSNDINPVHTYLSTGTYTVILTASSSTTGCTIDTSISITVSINSVVNSINSNEILFYPNPTINNLSVRMNAIKSNLSLKVSDLVGRELMRLNFCNNSTECQFDLSSLSSGLYFIEVVHDTELLYKNIVVKQ